MYTSVVVINRTRRCSSLSNEGCSDAHGCSISPSNTACKWINKKLTIAKFHKQMKNKDCSGLLEEALACLGKNCAILYRASGKKSCGLSGGHRMCPFETKRLYAYEQKGTKRIQREKE